MGSSKAAQDDKQMKVDKYKVRIDKAATEIAKLTEEVKTLEGEVAEIDKAQAEATALRATENADYLKASKDFKDSAEAVAKAIEVLKNFYEGSFVQISSKTTQKSKQPSFGSAKSDTASTIISVLEMSEEDFTTLLAETEATEDEAAKAYEKLTDENKISKATKETEAKAKASETKQPRHTRNSPTRTRSPRPPRRPRRRARHLRRSSQGIQETHRREQDLQG